MFAPENRPSQKETRIPTYSNHPFSGAMLVLGRVVNHFVDNVFFFGLCNLHETLFLFVSATRFNKMQYSPTKRNGIQSIGRTVWLTVKCIFVYHVFIWQEQNSGAKCEYLAVSLTILLAISYLLIRKHVVIFSQSPCCSILNPCQTPQDPLRPHLHPTSPIFKRKNKLAPLRLVGKKSFQILPKRGAKEIWNQWYIVYKWI